MGYHFSFVILHFTIIIRVILKEKNVSGILDFFLEKRDLSYICQNSKNNVNTMWTFSFFYLCDNIFYINFFNIIKINIYLFIYIP